MNTYCFNKNNQPNKKTCKKNKFDLNNLYEVEKFLCNLRKTIKCVELYKFLK